MSAGDTGAPRETDALLGRILSDRYKILQRVGEGGMGVVYLAQHVVIEKAVAVKVLFPELTRRDELKVRLLQEARSASRIGHPNVIDIFDFGESPEGFIYVVMEMLEGEDLGQLLRREGPMPWPRARRILMQVARALDAAHARGIIHRDMKPENVFLVQREGQEDFVKVLDFGLAKVISLGAGGPGAKSLTQTGTIFGTPGYMAPEQARGEAPDHRVDVYAVGCMMAHMMTGQPPFRADSFMEVIAKHIFDPPVPLREQRPDLPIPAAVDGITMRAMEKDREARWPDMRAFHDALAACPDDAPVDDDLRIATRRPAAADHGAARASDRGSAPRADSDASLDDLGDEIPQDVVPRTRVPAAVWIGAAAALVLGVGLWLAGRSGESAPSLAPAVAAPAAPGTLPPGPATAVPVGPGAARPGTAGAGVSSAPARDGRRAGSAVARRGTATEPPPFRTTTPPAATRTPPVPHPEAPGPAVPSTAAAPPASEAASTAATPETPPAKPAPSESPAPPATPASPTPTPPPPQPAPAEGPSELKNPFETPAGT